MANCSKCEVELIPITNWRLAHQKRNQRICRSCANKRVTEWKHKNPEKVHASSARYYSALRKKLGHPIVHSRSRPNRHVNRSMPTCARCETNLTELNWMPSRQRKHEYICLSCADKRRTKWCRDNPEKRQEQRVRAYENLKKRGGISHSHNPIQKCRYCSTILNKTNWWSCGSRYGIYICSSCGRTRVLKRWHNIPKDKKVLIDERAKWKTRLWVHGLNKNDILNMLQKQNDKCAICSTSINLSSCVDHSHETNQIRGMLCSACNAGLGMFKDAPQILHRAIEYLTSGFILNIDNEVAKNIIRNHINTAAKLKVRQILFDKQEGRCAICQNRFDGRTPYVDHDHSTNKIRGILCGPCNSGLGFFKDNVAIIRKAIDYLSFHNGLDLKVVLKQPH